MGAVKPYDTGHGRYKGILYNYDAVFAEPEDTCLYCLTKQQVAYLLSSLEPATWVTRWYSPTDVTIDHDRLEAVFSDLEVKLMTDACDIATQISDLKACCLSLTAKVQELTDMTCIATAQAMQFYRQDAISRGLPPSPSTTFTSDPTYTTQADLYAASGGLCSAVHRYIKTVLQNQLAALGLGGSVTAAAFALADPILGIVALGIAGATIAGFAAAIDDEAALDDVACCMYQGLRDKPVAFDSFKHCLDDCGFSFPDNNAQLAGCVGAANQDLANFTLFTQILQSETNAAAADSPTAYPVCGSCECGDTTDFTAGERKDWEIVMGTLGANGVESLTNTDNPFSSPHSTVRLLRHVNPHCHVETVRVFYRNTNNSEGRSTAGANNLLYIGADAGSDPCHSDWNSAGADTEAASMVQDNAVHSIDYSVVLDDTSCLVLFDVLSVWKYYITKITINP